MMEEEQYKQRILELENRVQKLRKTCNDQAETFASIDEENNRRYQELKEEKDQIEKELKSSRELVKTYKLCKEQMEEEYDELINRPIEVNNKAKEVEIEYIKDDVLNSEEYITLKEKYDNLYLKNDELNKKYIQIEKHYKLIKDEYVKNKDQLIEEIEGLRTQLALYEEREKEQNEFITNLQKVDPQFDGIDIDDVVSDTAPSLLSEFADMRESALNELEKYKDRFEKLKKKYCSMAIAYRRFSANREHTDVQEVRRHVKNNIELNNQNKNLQVELSKLYKFRDSWQESLRQLVSDNDKLKYLNTQLELKTKENDALRLENESNNRKIIKIQEELLYIPTLEREKTELESKIFILEERIRVLTGEKENLPRPPVVKFKTEETPKFSCNMKTDSQRSERLKSFSNKWMKKIEKQKKTYDN